MKYIIWIVIIALLGWGLYAFIDRREPAPAPVPDQAENNNNQGDIELAVREFGITGKPFSFNPNQIEVND